MTEGSDSLSTWRQHVVRTRTRREFDVWNEVPLVPQLTGMSCWAAAAAMVVGWRNRIPVNPPDVARASGHWQAYQDGLTPEDVLGLARTWDLVVQPAREWNVESLHALLAEVGPVWMGEASPGLHAIVVTGLFGDGSVDGTFVRVNDPWPLGRGERYVLPFRQLMQNFRAATDAVGVHAQVLHTSGRNSGACRQWTSEASVSSTISSPAFKEDLMAPYDGHAHARVLGMLPAGERYLRTATFAVDPLASHGGSGENLCIRWNELGDDITSIDVVVHFHGYAGRDPSRAMLEGKVARSGLDLAARSRATLGLVPRGRRITSAELERATAANHPVANSRYTFEGLVDQDGGGLEQLVAHALAWFSANVLGRASGSLTVDRLILTAHSGGGAALNKVVRCHATRRVCSPHEVHVFDGIYGSPGVQGDGIVSWARARSLADSTPGASAMRILYGSGTRRGSTWIASQLQSATQAVPRWYRVEYAGEDHNAIGTTHGPRLLADAGTDLVLPMAPAGGLSYGTPVELFRHYQRDPTSPPRRAAPSRLRGPVVAQRRPALSSVASSPGQTARSERELDELVAERGATADTGLALALRVRALATWPGDSVSVDCRHVQAYPGVCQPFLLNDATLAMLADANRFTGLEGNCVVFGLRGCRIVEPNDGRFHLDVTLDVDVPDHVDSHCVLGVWDRNSRQVAVFTGSTVPHERYMRQQVGDDGDKANMLLTGAHRFQVGRHRNKVNGVLLEAEDRVVLRSRDDLVYTTSDRFVIARPGDNLHPSFTPGSMRYSSAGCLTVRGDATDYNDSQDPDHHTDPSDGTPGWASFRERLGMTGAHAPQAEDGRAFSLMLLTGREASIVHREGHANNLVRLRFGSRGDDVRALQQFLQSRPSEAEGRYTGGVDGLMGPNTTFAWIRYQQHRDGGTADGIVTPADAASMGFALPGSMSVPGQGAYGRVVSGPGYGWRRPGVAVALVDNNSPQAEQSEAVRRNVARSVGAAETGNRFHLVHHDSSRVNFGVGSWTGPRIADLLDTYDAVAAELGRTSTLHGYFGGEATFSAIRSRFRTLGTRATLTSAEEGFLEALGRDVDLQEAQVRHLANDIQRELGAIGNTENNPWYPFIDAGMGAISECAAHVLVHAGHQGDRQAMVRDAVAHFGGEQAMSQARINGTLDEVTFLTEVGEQVVRRVRAEYRTGVRRRYQNLVTQYGASQLSYYFNPSY